MLNGVYFWSFTVTSYPTPLHLIKLELLILVRNYTLEDFMNIFFSFCSFHANIIYLNTGRRLRGTFQNICS